LGVLDIRLRLLNDCKHVLGDIVRARLRLLHVRIPFTRLLNRYFLLLIVHLLVSLRNNRRRCARFVEACLLVIVLVHVVGTRLLHF